ncbi:MAG: right-handed parallel beta-helix repeat-containing protein [Armatimonadetes bacterium]|nr:right-handed parallel beta-helix repeat-containing protein [Armatimonadota bacterium]
MRKLILMGFLLILLYVTVNATIINIPGDQPTIQAGINVTVDGDTVLVQPGNYVENINYNGKNITVASFFLTTQDTTYISQTEIDGNSSGSVVTFESGETNQAKLIGFSITNGYTWYLGGGGILCDGNSSPIIKNNLIRNNFSGIDGGGIFCYDFSNPEIINNTILNNSSVYGGGISCYTLSNPIITNNIINHNDANHGGGIYLGMAYWGIQIRENLIQNNYSSSSGGGIFSHTSSPNITGNIIKNNHSETYGGGIYQGPCSYIPIIINNIIYGNSADLYGGGIYCYDGIDPLIINNCISNNSSEYGGGIACRFDCSPQISNCTISNNMAIYQGGGLYVTTNSNPVITNTIFWADEALLDGNEIYLNWSNPDFYYCDIQGGINSIGIIPGSSYTGIYEHNIDLNPLFLELGEHPYSITFNSPCINSGIPDTTGLNLPYLDLAGNPRVYGGRIDMGAYENQNVVSANEDLIPLVTKLNQNYPNPFNPTTTISFSILDESNVEISIYNIKGQKVKKLISDQLSAGKHSVVWDGEDDNNQPVGSGIYFYKLRAGDFQKVRKMILLK